MDEVFIDSSVPFLIISRYLSNEQSAVTSISEIQITF